MAYANPTSPVSVEVVNEAVESFPFALATSLPAESFVDGRTSEPILVDAAKVLEP